jgi:hypothetical protein
LKSEDAGMAYDISVRRQLLRNADAYDFTFPIYKEMGLFGMIRSKAETPIWGSDPRSAPQSSLTQGDD